MTNVFASRVTVLGGPMYNATLHTQYEPIIAPTVKVSPYVT